MRAEIPFFFIFLLGACVSQLECGALPFDREENRKYEDDFNGDYDDNDSDCPEKQTTIELPDEAGSSRYNNGGEQVPDVPKWFATAWQHPDRAQGPAFQGHGVSVDGRFHILHDSIVDQLEHPRERDFITGGIFSHQKEGVAIRNIPKINTLFPRPNHPDYRWAKDIDWVKRDVANSGFGLYDNRPGTARFMAASQNEDNKLRPELRPFFANDKSYYGDNCSLYAYSKGPRPEGVRADVPTPLEFARMPVEKKDCKDAVCQLSITSNWQFENPGDCYGGQNWSGGAPVLCGEKRAITYMALPNSKTCSKTFQAYHVPHITSEIKRLRDGQHPSFWQGILDTMRDGIMEIVFPNLFSLPKDFKG